MTMTLMIMDIIGTGFDGIGAAWGNKLVQPFGPYRELVRPVKGRGG